MDGDNDTIMSSENPPKYQQVLPVNTASANAAARGKGAAYPAPRPTFMKTSQELPDESAPISLITTLEGPGISHGVYGPTASFPVNAGSVKSAPRANLIPNRVTHGQADKIIGTSPSLRRQGASRSTQYPETAIRGSSSVSRVDLTQDEDEPNTTEQSFDEREKAALVAARRAKDTSGRARNRQAAGTPTSSSTQIAAHRSSPSGIDRPIRTPTGILVPSPATDPIRTLLMTHPHLFQSILFPTENKSSPGSQANGITRSQIIAEPGTGQTGPTLQPVLVDSIYWKDVTYVFPKGPKAHGFDIVCGPQDLPRLCEVWRDKSGELMRGPPAGIFLFNPVTNVTSKVVVGGRPVSAPPRRPFNIHDITEIVRRETYLTEIGTQRNPYQMKNTYGDLVRTQRITARENPEDQYFGVRRARAPLGNSPSYHIFRTDDAENGFLDGHTPRPDQAFPFTSIPDRTTQAYGEVSERRSALNLQGQRVQLGTPRYLVHEQGQLLDFNRQNIEPSHGQARALTTRTVRSSVPILREVPRNKKRSRVVGEEQTQIGNPAHAAEPSRPAPALRTRIGTPPPPIPSVVEASQAPTVGQNQSRTQTPTTSGLTSNLAKFAIVKNDPITRPQKPSRRGSA